MCVVLGPHGVLNDVSQLLWCVLCIGDVVFVVFALLATVFNRGKTRA